MKKTRWVFVILDNKEDAQVTISNLFYVSVTFRVVPLPNNKWEIAVKRGDEGALRLSVPFQYYGKEVYDEQA